jgi:TorA maturation chaperone TorD
MEIFRALAVLAEPPERAGAERVAAALGLGPPPDESDYTETFVFQLYPFASVYLGGEGMLGGEARDRVGGFWRALGQTPPAEPDYLPVMLALYARLCEFEEGETREPAREGWRAARRAYLWEHLLSWLPVYLDKLAEIAPPFYCGWGELLESALGEEARAVGPLGELPLALREAPPVLKPREAAAEEFLSSLLAPARSGMILTRADLARCARTLGLGLRAGERRFALEAMLGQDAPAVLGWLAAEVAEWAARHARRRERFGPIALWWSARATAAAALLTESAREAGQAT